MTTTMDAEEARKLSDNSRKDLPRIKVISPWSASWTKTQEPDGKN